MPKRYSDSTGPRDNPLNIAIEQETLEERIALEADIEVARRRLSAAITAMLDELRVRDALSYDIFMKRRFEQELTKDKRPKAKSFRKISQEVGLVGRESDPRHAERQARVSYDNTCKLLKSCLRVFQAEYSELRSKLRRLMPD